MRTLTIHFLGLIVVLAANICSTKAQAGVWTPPTSITDLGAWGPWFGVTVTDSNAEIGCPGGGTKAIDISTPSPVKKAQMALLMVAFAKKQKVTLYYDGCRNGVSIITNVHVLQ